MKKSLSTRIFIPRSEDKKAQSIKNWQTGKEYVRVFFFIFFFICTKAFSR
jgi:hypothetical protein